MHSAIWAGRFDPTMEDAQGTAPWQVASGLHKPCLLPVRDANSSRILRMNPARGRGQQADGNDYGH